MKITIESVGNGYTVTVWRNESDISPEVFVYQRLYDLADAIKFVREPDNKGLSDYLSEIVDPKFPIPTPIPEGHPASDPTMVNAGRL